MGSVLQEPSLLQARVLELAACVLAAGLDPARAVLFVQSAVPRHAELCWLLTCLATHARLAHLPQYKEKAATMKEVPLGLLLYPVLQVAFRFLLSHLRSVPYVQRALAAGGGRVAVRRHARAGGRGPAAAPAGGGRAGADLRAPLRPRLPRAARAARR